MVVEIRRKRSVLTAYRRVGIAHQTQVSAISINSEYPNNNPDFSKKSGFFLSQIMSNTVNQHCHY